MTPAPHDTHLLWETHPEELSLLRREASTGTLLDDAEDESERAAALVVRDCPVCLNPEHLCVCGRES